MEPVAIQIGTLTCCSSGAVISTWSLFELYRSMNKGLLLAKTVGQTRRGPVYLKGTVEQLTESKTPEAGVACAAWICEAVHYVRRGWNVVTLLHSFEPIYLKIRTGVVRVDLTHVDCRYLTGVNIPVLPPDREEYYRGLAGVDAGLPLGVTEFRIFEGDTLYVRGELKEEDGQKILFGTPHQPVVLEGMPSSNHVSHVIGLLIGITLAAVGLWLDSFAPLDPILRVGMFVGGAAVGLFIALQPHRRIV